MQTQGRAPQTKGEAGTNARKQVTLVAEVWLDPWWRGERGIKLQRDTVARSFRALDFLKKSLDVF